MNAPPAASEFMRSTTVTVESGRETGLLGGIGFIGTVADIPEPSAPVMAGTAGLFGLG